MKKNKSLLALALVGAAVAFTSGCSSTGMRADTTGDKNAAYRWASSSGWAPITDIRQMNKFPMEWNPVWYETTKFAVPVQDNNTITVTSSDIPTFNENLRPGDVFVEAAGASDRPARVKQIILYSPFGSGH